MTDHPLTDEDCKQILIDVSDSWDPEFEWYPDLRAAYDKGAADTLERVIEWLRQHLTMEVASVNLKERDLLLEDLKKAMHQQLEDN